jgi:hypothetical protein
MSVERPQLDLAELLPEIELIRDESLRDGVAAVWHAIWAESRFEAVADVPIGPGIPNKHLPHNRAVVAMALSVADAIEEFHGIAVDRDVLVAAGLLQDVSKLVEMAPSGDGVEQTEIGRGFQHAFWAAHKSLEHGLPMAVCEIVMNHTPQSPRFPASLEGKILFYVDQLDLIAVSGEKWSKRLYLTR